jgi:hypothetical protein
MTEATEQFQDQENNQEDNKGFVKFSDSEDGRHFSFCFVINRQDSAIKLNPFWP